MDADGLEGEPQPWELRSKPAWQRLLIMMGGIIVKCFAGFLFFGWWWYLFGEKIVFPLSKLKHGISWDSVALNIGFT